MVRRDFFAISDKLLEYRADISLACRLGGRNQLSVVRWVLYQNIEASIPAVEYLIQKEADFIVNQERQLSILDYYIGSCLAYKVDAGPPEGIFPR